MGSSSDIHPVLPDRSGRRRAKARRRRGPYLVVRGVDPGVWNYALRRGRQTVGRSRLCDLRIMHDSVSRLHADIRWERDGFTLRDMNSQNGSYVNGRRISQSSFAVGDSIRLGSVVLDVQLLPSESKGPASVASIDQLASSEARDPGLSTLILQAKLSRAQEQVLRLLLQGMSEKQIAARLHLSRHTVHAHVKSIYRALGVHARTELLTRFWAQGGETQA
jgi:pSer/pThr/pTyr-binding forkhead associated (FHA) protein